MLLAANSVLSNGYVTLKSAFTQSFPSVDYNVTYARRRLLQMPLACIRIEFDSGVSVFPYRAPSKCQLQFPPSSHQGDHAKEQLHKM